MPPDTPRNRIRDLSGASLLVVKGFPKIHLLADSTPDFSCGRGVELREVLIRKLALVLGGLQHHLEQVKVLDEQSLRSLSLFVLMERLGQRVASEDSLRRLRFQLVLHLLRHVIFRDKITNDALGQIVHQRHLHARRHIQLSLRGSGGDIASNLACTDHKSSQSQVKFIMPLS